MLEINELKKKLKRACDALETIREFETHRDSLIDHHVSLRLFTKRHAGDALIDVGAMVVRDGEAVYIGVDIEGRQF